MLDIVRDTCRVKESFTQLKLCQYRIWTVYWEWHISHTGSRKEYFSQLWNILRIIMQGCFGSKAPDCQVSLYLYQLSLSTNSERMSNWSATQVLKQAFLPHCSKYIHWLIDIQCMDQPVWANSHSSSVAVNVPTVLVSIFHKLATLCDGIIFRVSRF